MDIWKCYSESERCLIGREKICGIHPNSWMDKTFYLLSTVAEKIVGEQARDFGEWCKLEFSNGEWIVKNKNVRIKELRKARNNIRRKRSSKYYCINCCPSLLLFAAKFCQKKIFWGDDIGFCSVETKAKWDQLSNIERETMMKKIIQTYELDKGKDPVFRAKKILEERCCTKSQQKFFLDEKLTSEFHKMWVFEGKDILSKTRWEVKYEEKEKVEMPQHREYEGHSPSVRLQVTNQSQDSIDYDYYFDDYDYEGDDED